MLAEHYNSTTLKDAELKVNNLPFTADGTIRHFPENRHTRIDMDMGLKISDMNDLLKFIPDAYFQNRDKIQAEGSSYGRKHSRFLRGQYRTKCEPVLPK